MGELDEQRDQAIEKANAKSISIAEVRKEIEGIDDLLTSVNLRFEELEAEKAAQNEKIDSLTSKKTGIDSLKIKHKVEYDNLNALKDKLTKERLEVEAGNDEFEKESNDIRQKQKEKNASYQTLTEYSVRNENKLAQLKEKQERLGSQLWDDYEITYEDAVALDYPPVTAENREEIAAIQSSCRSKLRSIGNFNPNAIEEYADVKTRYDDLTAQYNDVANSKEETIGIIARIEEEMRSHFINAFNSINKNFAITFKELFGGGSAELSLTEPEDVLTSGIEIKAAPPGKIIKSMSLLSGGEQSFVAIALLFAILKVNPTPFCILDEIEAALDEVNVFRFGEYVKKLCDDTQFILITHRRGTMEIGDRLYGVTMPQRGISQAIELNVNEIEGKQKELLDGIL
jgi:chromosome segregation protein